MSIGTRVQCVVCGQTLVFCKCPSGPCLHNTAGALIERLRARVSELTVQLAARPLPPDYEQTIGVLRAQVEILEQMQANDAASAAKAIKECVELRAQVEELDGRLQQVGQRARHYKSIAVEYESRATRAEAERDEAKEMAIEWIPVTERLPEKDGYVLTYSIGGAIRTECFFSDPLWGRRAETFEERRSTAKAYGEASVHFNHALDYGYTVTHWAMYPKPPKAALAECGE